MRHQPLSIRGNIWINKGEECFLGAGRITLLNTVIQEGSIRAASQKLGISYQKAWNTIEQMNRLSPIPVLIPKRGGKDGGGVQLTGYGQKIIHEMNRIETEFNQFLMNLNKESNLCF